MPGGYRFAQFGKVPVEESFVKFKFLCDRYHRSDVCALRIARNALSITSRLNCLAGRRFAFTLRLKVLTISSMSFRTSSLHKEIDQGNANAIADV